MSKERTAALKAVQDALKNDAVDPPAEAIVVLIGDGLNSLGRIAAALETLAKPPQLLAAGEVTQVGELLHAEPLIPVDLVRRGIEALEKLASPPPTQ